MSGRTRLANHIPQGGGNFANFNCAPASVSPATGQPGAGLIFAASVHRRRRRQCRREQLLRLLGSTADIIPEDDRHNLMLKLERDVNDSLTLTADFIYARQRNVTQHQSRLRHGHGVRTRAARRPAARGRSIRSSPVRRASTPRPCVSRPTSCSARARSSWAARSRCSERSRRTMTSARTGARCSARRSVKTTAGRSAKVRSA